MDRTILQASDVILWLICGLLFVVSSAVTKAGELQSFLGCTLVEMKGSDGDSFKVRFPDGSYHIVRLYGVDCLEAKIWDEADYRRLKEQQLYFGIRNSGDSADDSIELAKKYGELAGAEIVRVLAKPFVVHTAFADGRGSGYHKRIYSFVTMNGGEDLGSHLIKTGLARAYGVKRSTPKGDNHEEMKARLLDLEMVAAIQRKGIWAHTDLQTLAKQRAERRAEEAEIEAAIDRYKYTSVVNPNTAARDDLMTLSGIGEKIALRIIEGRPYRDARDLLKVKGLGEATLKNLDSRLPLSFNLQENTD